MIAKYSVAAWGIIICATLLLTCGKDKNSTNPTMEPAIPQQGLMAHYAFNNDADDGSSNNNDGTLMGGATATGYLNIRRNATDALSLPRRVLDGVEDFTASAWMRIDTLQTNSNSANVFVSGGNGNISNALVLYYFSTNRQWIIYLNNTNYRFNENIVIEDKKWHHVAVMRSGAVARMYIDDNEVGNGITITADPLELDANRLLVGQYEPSPRSEFSWAGAIDNLCFFDRALSAEEVQQLANEAHSN